MKSSKIRYSLEFDEQGKAILPKPVSSVKPVKEIDPIKLEVKEIRADLREVRRLRAMGVPESIYSNLQQSAVERALKLKERMESEGIGTLRLSRRRR